MIEIKTRLKRRKNMNPRPIKKPPKVRIKVPFIPYFLEETEEDFKTNWDESVESFDDMGLKEDVLRGIYGYGFVKPSPIQQKGILPIIQGKDTIAQVIFILNNKSLTRILYRLNLVLERPVALL
jgi:hypothetical protein